MAHALLCVLLAFFAVAVISQTCDVKSLTYTDILSTGSSAFTVDAKTLSLKGSTLTVNKGSSTAAGSVAVEYQRGQGYSAAVDKTKSLVTIKKVIADGASQLGGVNFFVTLALAAVALLSQRGSMAALALVLAIATVALAACATTSTVNVTIFVDQMLLQSFVLQVKPTTAGACPSATDISIAGDLAKSVASSSTAQVCSYTFTNAVFGCPNTCGTVTTNVMGTKCVNGTCSLTCNAGFQPCNNDCLTAIDILTSCGTCTNDCSTSVKNAVNTSCVAGACTFDSCAPGFSNCDSATPDNNGCEAATSSPTACGGCSNNCSALPGIDTTVALTCTNSTCGFTCLAGKADCDMNSLTGCEADLTLDSSCGSCRNVCNDTTTQVNTVSGTCNATATPPGCSFQCTSGFADCLSSLGSPGCETQTSTSPTNCGTCGNDCSALPQVNPTTTACTAGKCVIQCSPGFQDCDGLASNGCEVDVSANSTSCGSCSNNCGNLTGVSAANTTCNSSTCVFACLPGFANCGGNGVGCPDDTSSSTANCGGCANPCNGILNAVRKCTSGVCDYVSCLSGFFDCNNDRTDGCEVNINTTVGKCGTCTNNCLAGSQIQSATCNAGVCALTCNSAYTNCDSLVSNGCEVNTGSNVAACGSCSNACSLLNTATYTCNVGICQVATCKSNFSQCGAAATAGCPINTQIDASNCGSCGNLCSSLANVNSNINCVAGVCQVAANCKSLFSDCDGSVSNGCETPTSVCTPVTPGTSNCVVSQGYTGFQAGYVGTDCSKDIDMTNVLSSTCSLSTAPIGTCNIKCKAGFSDCDKNPKNGCEAADALCSSANTTGFGCESALKDPVAMSGVSCLLLTTDPMLNQTVTQGSNTNVCNQQTGKCTYTCDANHYDCDLSAINGCEVDTRKCPTAGPADCVFNNNTRCGLTCVNCLTLSGTNPGTAKCNATTEQCYFTCDNTLCRDVDGIASNGCEQAQTYANVPGLTALDCSKDIDLTNVLVSGPILCDGNPLALTAGRCLFSCKPGFKDCDDNPANGCETQLIGTCTSCVFQADVSCGKNKCVDCTLLDGTLGSDYANGRWASASASTCTPINATLDPRSTDYYCDTAVHYLNPRFDPPDGNNGACQSELCRDLDGDWSNGCESAQQYGRGRFYYYGDSTSTDSYLVPYVPNPYEDRFYDYKDTFTAFVTGNSGSLIYPVSDDIFILSLVKSNIVPGYTLRSLIWQNGASSLAGTVNSPSSFIQSTLTGFVYSALGFSSASGSLTSSFLGFGGSSQFQLSPNIALTGREIALLHYAADVYTQVDTPAEAAAISLMGEVYKSPVDCVLSEWSDWGLCTYADDCIRRDYFRMTRVRTRKVITPATNGGVCHLPLVEDFYRFSHRNSVGNVPDFTNVDFLGFPTIHNNGSDNQHGGGFAYKVDYTNSMALQTVFDVNNVLLWGPQDWSFSALWTGSFSLNEPKDLSWTGNTLGFDLGSNSSADRGRFSIGATNAYGLLLTCAPARSCRDTNSGVDPIACNITAWSSWSPCSATCDGDWAGGVRIRTRTVISGAHSNGECFETEFSNVTGLPYPLYGASAGMLYEEDWQCNDHSCASYDCNTLKDATFAAASHIYLGADAVKPQCDGRDWSEYVNGISWVDVNRDGLDDNTQYAVRGDSIYAMQGNFPLWNTIYNFSYEYRWPGHCLYECEQGWFDCDHRPDNGCETNGDFCSIDAEFGSTTQLMHPIKPWEHPHGDCTIAWKHDQSGVIARDCTDFAQRHPELLDTVGKCIPVTGFCDTTCDAGYANCAGSGCLKVDGRATSYCGSACVDCTQLNVFQYGHSAGWSCMGDAQSDYTCKPQSACTSNCFDMDSNIFNGCETAVYEQWPYPDVTPTDVTMDAWSSWTQCSRSDDCGYLWDMTTGANVFRNVPLQTRYRRPVTSAYNGGFYPEFSLLPASSLDIAGVSFPSLSKFNLQLTFTPLLKDLLGLPLVQTPFYEVRICDTPITPCIECTNQLEGIEQHCTLSAWSKWSACSAECVDRIIDLDYHGKTTKTATEFLSWDPNNSYYVTDRTPYQIRTRSVTQAASLGGRCPPPLDTWQLAEAASNVPLISNVNGNNPGVLVDGVSSNALLSAKASFIVDVRKCNTANCQYPEDCDALNYWYPGHFSSVATCGKTTNVAFNNALSQCVATTGFDSSRFSASYANGCNPKNGYCDTVNGDLRDGCDTFVYPNHCGRPTSTGQCDYDLFFDCTTLPGVVSPFAAPCVIDPSTSGSGADSFAFSNPSSEPYKQICDIRWACNATACTDESYVNRSYSSLPKWHDGCEVARAYKYPFVTVKSNFLGNSMSYFFNLATNSGVLVTDTLNTVAEESINMLTFHDPRNKYNLSAVPQNNSILFNFDCHGFLYSSDFCGHDGDSDFIKEPVFPYVTLLAGKKVSFRPNEGCHLSGHPESDKFDDIGFGCNGMWNTPNWGMCTMNCAPGYVDADLDPRNGCETDVFESATPEDHYVWVGNCNANTNGGVTITNSASCGADQCIDCSSLPGVKSTPPCGLVEESANMIPVLRASDKYYSIQYACGVFTGTPAYQGVVDFNDGVFCDPDFCADGDKDWTNGCEQGRGYNSRIAYVMGGVYDNLFDRKNFINISKPGFFDGNNSDCMNVASNNFFTASNGTACDARSSGFEFPVPGAWFFQNYSSVSGDNMNLGRSSWPVSALSGPFWADLASLNALISADSSFSGVTVDTPEVALNKRAFDCSLLYSTELIYAPVTVAPTPADPFGKYRYVVSFTSYKSSAVRDGAIWTFAQVHHINVSVYPVGGVNNVCNRITGLCNFVCQNGWDDYDLDPSNGCEADLSGPCGSPFALMEKRYENKGSCGGSCVNCDTLPGSYLTPVVKSGCRVTSPENFLDERKGDYVLGSVRFVHSCVTEHIRPLDRTLPSNDSIARLAWRNIVCDPTSCSDDDWDYDNGCELATDYPYQWQKQYKISSNHWYSPLPSTNLTLYPRNLETAYWLRDDGLVTIGRSPSEVAVAKPTNRSTDYWFFLFDLHTLNSFDYWDIRDIAGYRPYLWYNASAELTASSQEFYTTLGNQTGNNVFPYKGITSSWDCSTSKLMSGSHTFNIGGIAGYNLTVPWTVTTEMEGPWFHVNQSRVSQCNPGPDPGAATLSYTAGNNNIIRTSYCKPDINDVELYNKGCYDTWVTKGSGHCALACDALWADGDADPSNGCESYLNNSKPYPLSNCGQFFKNGNPTLDANYPNGAYNYNQGKSCGAGLCLPCASLSGVNKAAQSPNAMSPLSLSGLQSSCVDGGNSWFAAEANAVANYPEQSSTGPALKSGIPDYTGDLSVVKYPGDYYCSGIINDNACLRVQLSMSCRGSASVSSSCDSISHLTYPKAGGGLQAVRLNASYISVCEDRDLAWETGCEVALGYNLYIDNRGPTNITSVPSSTGSIITLEGLYKRSVGVKPFYSGLDFSKISWNGPSAGFDCEILRYLPVAHTHIDINNLAIPIECSSSFLGFAGVCSFKCTTGWVDCDLNPWNGCEQSDVLCGGSGAGNAGCEAPQRYPLSTTAQPTCPNIASSAELSRSSFCDGNQLPYDDWHIYYVANAGFANNNDQSQYDDYFQIEDWGIDHVDVMTNYVDALVSRYTIKGYWDNDDIDYSCRVWLSGTDLRSSLPADANAATGRCTLDCKETNGYSNCDGIDSNGCENHVIKSQCRTSSGVCTSCGSLPGIIGTRSNCLSTKTVGLSVVNIDSFSTNFDVGAYGIDAAPNKPYIVAYGFAAGLSNISNTYPQCDTRGVSSGQSAGTAACDDNLCRDYDGDWENGCEFPMKYTLPPINWETPGALYKNPSIIVVDGFDCSWISDPQPDAGGHNYGGKTWAQKYHVNTDVNQGGSLGYCVGTVGPSNGMCNIVCQAGWSDCDTDPSNGCENDDSLCAQCVLALGYPDSVSVNCTTLVDEARGFVPFAAPNLPKCNGREGQDGECSYYFCNIFSGSCDAGLGQILNTIGCINLTTSASDTYCGADWNWRDIRGNESTVGYVSGTADYAGGRMLDYSNFDGTGRCASCNDLNGYVSASAVCVKDPVVAGHTNDRVTYYKPAASGWIDNSLGQIYFNTAGNTVGDYLCQLHASLDSGLDGSCTRNLCVDEDYYWANGCETAVNYPATLLATGEAGPQRHLSTGSANFGFDYHFAYNDDIFGRQWPFNAAVNGVQKSSSARSEIRGVWCPFLQFWSLSTDNYITGECDVFPCPHFHPTTVNTWITCVNNATDAMAGKCNFECNLADGWKDCDSNPLTGCETDIFSDGTCGSECQNVECNAVDGLNPNYWSECMSNNGTSVCDLSVCENTLCRNLDGDWTNGCETAVNYISSETHNCRFLMANSELARLHLEAVMPCNGEIGNHWAGKCEFTCEAGWIDCDHDFKNGCEHDGSLCQDCTKALGYVTHFDGADWWEFWGAANMVNDHFYSVVYGSRFDQSIRDLTSFSLVDSPFADNHTLLHDQFEGPNVAYSKYHQAFVAAFDCATLRATYPGHFTAVPITCDSDVTQATAGRCIYSCDSTNGYYDCDGDPRNGCEHYSQHSSCGGNGACRNCYYISGVDYPVDQTGDQINDGSQGPYSNGAFGVLNDGNGRNYGDVYAERNVTYFGLVNKNILLKVYPDPNNSPLRLGCTYDPSAVTVQGLFTCNLDTCITTVGNIPCINRNNANNVPDAWKDGCEEAQFYDFNGDKVYDTFNCALMGPDALNQDAPRATNDHNLPSFHIRQVVGTVGCDSQVVNYTNIGSDLAAYNGKGAWRYLLARVGRVNSAIGNETSGIWAFDYQGLANFFMTNTVLKSFENLSDLSPTVSDFVLYRVRGSDRIGTCYYECEYGYEDCNGDPRDGCEIKISACIDLDGNIGWDWASGIATNGCEVALGYSSASVNQTDAPFLFSCSTLQVGRNVNVSKPIYCRGGQDGKIDNLGTCEFTCNDGFQDCDGHVYNGCETPISDDACDCVSCVDYLPGTLSIDGNNTLALNFTRSMSTCVNSQCTLPCDTTLCMDKDSNPTNGCETAMAYPNPRVGSSAFTNVSIGTFDCATWAKEPLTAKKHHIDPSLLGEISCEGRPLASNKGTCSYQRACLKRSGGGFNNYQDCNSDPRDGCEDTARWCGVGKAQSGPAPRGTPSDLCSKALRYLCTNGFDANDQQCDSTLVVSNNPAFDCEDLFRTKTSIQNSNIDNSTVVPYCDRDPTHLATRGDCVVKCSKGWANCNNDLATDGCEANISQDTTCNGDCVNCIILPGVDNRSPPKCIADSLSGYKCNFTCIAGVNSSSCADRDGKWQNGCEVALNDDLDKGAVFVNFNQPMDCSVMQEEAKKNPELFRHHLHIDLDKVSSFNNIPYPAGSIFCNTVDSNRGVFGTCLFTCIPGFANSDAQSWNGCEVLTTTTSYPFIHGGYLIGDYSTELYIKFLQTLQIANILPISYPKNLSYFDLQVSSLYKDTSSSLTLLQVIWY